MKIKNILYVVVLIFFAGSVKGQTKFDHGKIENNIYYNSFFNSTMHLPKNWVVVDLPFENDFDKEDVKDISEIFSATLLSVFKYPLNSGALQNPGISIVVENLADYPEVKNGSDYLEFVKNGLENDPEIENRIIDGVLKKEMINGNVFYKLDLTEKSNGVVLKQSYCTTVVNGFSFSIIYVYENDAELNLIKNSIKTLNFKN